MGKNPYHVKFGEKMETFIYPGVNTYTWWGKSPPKNWREKDMRENMEVGWIEENEFQKVLSEASARMTKSTGQTCHIKGRGNYFKRRE